MRKLFAVIALSSTLALGACSTVNIAAFLQNLADVEKQAVEIVAKIRQGVAVASAAVDTTINSVCVAVPQLNAGVQNVMAAVPNPGPKTREAIRVASISVATASSACAAYVTAPPSASGRVAVLRNLWAAYTAAKKALADANAAGGA